MQEIYDGTITLQLTQNPALSCSDQKQVLKRQFLWVLYFPFHTKKDNL